MIKKIKSNIKSLNKKKESSLLDFVLELNETNKVKNPVLSNRADRRKFNKYKEQKIKLRDEEINGHLENSLGLLRNKSFAEDKENISQKLSKINTKDAKGQDYCIRNYFKPLTRYSKPISKIEFFDEYNKKSVKLNQFEAKDVEFTRSKILPKIIVMKVDNDVMTDSEQLTDALKMMRDNMKETMKLIGENKDYLNKNLSKKIKFCSNKMK